MKTRSSISIARFVKRSAKREHDEGSIRRRCPPHQPDLGRIQVLRVVAKTAIAVISILALFSCILLFHPKPPEGFSYEFFWMPAEQRDAEFLKQDFDTQYKLYIYGSQQIEPPVIDLAYTMAKQGAKIVEPLRAKLEATHDDLTITDILYVFTAMSALESYDVAGNKPLMQELLEKSEAIKDPASAIVAQDDIHDITLKCKCELRK